MYSHRKTSKHEQIIYTSTTDSHENRRYGRKEIKKKDGKEKWNKDTTQN